VGRLGAVFEPAQWMAFLSARGIDVYAAVVTRLIGGEVNENWRIDVAGGQSWVLRHYQRTSEPAEIDCELAAVDALARSGFPTPAPVLAAGDHGQFWETVEGRPAAVFTFADGRHPVEREGGYGSTDLELGLRSAELVGRMHLALAGETLPGRRAPSRDPWRRVTAFLASDMTHEPAFARLLDPLRNVQARLAPVYAEPTGMPFGLIHNDVGPTNLLLHDDGGIAALLDFDDSAQTFLGYELGAITGNFGRDEQRRPDVSRLADLVNAYDAVRPLTLRERALIPDLLAVGAAAEGIHVLTNWLRASAAVVMEDSYSALAFLELVRLRPTLLRTFGPLD
jgi:Ser/Thr protein kinase RdoA (MazF antagonist)